LDQQVFLPKIQKPPKSAGHYGSQDEHQITGKNMDSSIEGSGHQISRENSPSFHQTILEKPSPEDFLSRAGDEEQKQKDENLIRPRSQRINSSYLGFYSWKNIGSKFVSDEKNGVKDHCRKEPEKEGAELKRDLWPLPQ
jgi:hypothetical protein